MKQTWTIINVAREVVKIGVLTVQDTGAPWEVGVMNSSPGSLMDLRDRQLSVVDSPAAWRRLGLAVAVSTIGSVGVWSVPVALPFVQADFGITRAEVSLPYTLAMTGFALGGVAMGRLCDSFGVVVAVTLGSLAPGIGFVGVL